MSFIEGPDMPLPGGCDAIQVVDPIESWGGAFGAVRRAQTTSPMSGRFLGDRRDGEIRGIAKRLDAGAVAAGLAVRRLAQFGDASEFDVPRQQLVDTLDRVIGDALEHRAQLAFGIDAVELGRAQQAVDGRRSGLGINPA